MFDLANATPKSVLEEEKTADMVDQHAFRFDVAVRLADGVVFYDRDGGGQVDLILMADPDHPDMAGSRFVRKDGHWTYEVVNARLLDPAYLASAARGKRFASFMAAISRTSQ